MKLMPTSVFALLTFLIFVTEPAVAGDYEKNGLPCVKEICLGDGIEQLKTIRWKQAVLEGRWTGRIYGGMSRDAVPRVYKGDTSKVVKYLTQGYFDSNALVNLGAIKVNCGSSQDLLGTYTSKDGNETEVYIALLPDPVGESLEQNWRVIGIERKFKPAITKQQKKELTDAIEERYGDLIRSSYQGKAPAKIEYSEPGAYLKMRDARTGLSLSERMREHPECGNNHSIKVD